MIVDLAAQHAMDRLNEAGFDRISESERILATVWQFAAGVANHGFAGYYGSRRGDLAFAQAIEGAELLHLQRHRQLRQDVGHQVAARRLPQREAGHAAHGAGRRTRQGGRIGRHGRGSSAMASDEACNPV